MQPDQLQLCGHLLLQLLGRLDRAHLHLLPKVGVKISAANRSISSTTGCTITEKAPTRAFTWLKAPTSAFTFKTLLRHYAKRALPLGLST